MLSRCVNYTLYLCVHNFITFRPELTIYPSSLHAYVSPTQCDHLEDNSDVYLAKFMSKECRLSLPQTFWGSECQMKLCFLWFQMAYLIPRDYIIKSYLSIELMILCFFDSIQLSIYLSRDANWIMPGWCLIGLLDVALSHFIPLLYVIIIKSTKTS